MKDTKLQTTNQEVMPVDSSAEALIAKAIDKNVPVETMERLLAMRRELKAEKAKEDFDRAMAAFQAEMPMIEKRKQGYNYKYAPLESIVEQIKDLLSKNGFSYTFDTEEAQNAVVIICNVKHISGHAEISKATITKETTTKMNASQQSGAAMTYGKRYAFVNAFGILTGDEDTDGATAHIQSPSPKPAQPAQDSIKAAIQRASDKQISFIKQLLIRKGRLEGEVLEKYKVEKLEELTVSQASFVIKNLGNLPDDDGEASQIADDAIEAGL